ncbi:MAG: serine/threonine protein kinase [Gloeotrichia echinulata GP01]
MIPDQAEENNHRESTDQTNEISENKIQEALGREMESQEGIWQRGHQLKNGRYIIQETLGEGGFGIAYRTQDTQLNRDVVIKTLNKNAQNDQYFPKWQEDFYKEAKRLSKCEHPNIVKIYDIFREEGLQCIVMEYIPGETLADRLERGILEEEEALKYIRQIGEALQVVHRNNLVHRDVKPRNIMIRENTREAVLIDFGIAREFSSHELIIHTISFSESYAPLEQYLENEPKGPYTDVYALAATLYVLLTGKTPATAEDRSKNLNINGTDPLQPPQHINKNIRYHVNIAIIKGLTLSPRERPQSIQEWLDLLTKKKPIRLGNDSNILGLLGRATLMSVGIWLLALSLVNLREVNFEIRTIVSLLFGVGLVFLAQYRLPPSEPKIYLFISGIVPTGLIFISALIFSLNLKTFIDLPIVIIGVVIFTFTVMAVLKLGSESDD